MAKVMAVITENVVTNIIWCNENRSETDKLKNTEDRPICIGDTYIDGNFYHDGNIVLTPMEQLQQDVRDAELENNNIKNILDILLGIDI